MKSLTFLVIGIFVSFYSFSQQNGGPCINDDSTVLLIHFNNDLTFEGSYTGNVQNWGNEPVYGNSLTGFGQAFRMNNEGGLQCILIEPTSELNLGRDWRIEFWVKVGNYGSGSAAFPSLFIKDGQGVAAIVIGFRSDGHGFNCGVTFDNLTEIRIEQETGLEIEKWHHLILASDSTEACISFTVHDQDWNKVFSDSRSFPEGTDGTLCNAERKVFLGGVDGSSNIQFDGWIDEFRISNSSRVYHPEPPALIAESEHTAFYATETQSEYWDEIKNEIDQWFLELCSYWDRPGLDNLFDEEEKVKIFLVGKEELSAFINFDFPDWKYGGYKVPNEIYVSIPPGGRNDIYEDSFSRLVKNTLAQLILKKKQIRGQGGYCPSYFAEAFGLFYSGFYINSNTIIEALSELGHIPVINDIKSMDDFTSINKRSLMVSYIEAQALSVVGIQKLGPDVHETIWQHHLTYFYENDVANRIVLQRQTNHFNIYSTPQDIQFMDDIAGKLEEKFEHYTTLFEFPILHKFNCVVYPNAQAGLYCMVILNDYNGGSAWSGDNIDFLSPTVAWGGLDEALRTLIPHEFFHGFHFNLVTHLFAIPSFHSEGMAEIMAYESVNDEYLANRSWYFKEGLERFKNEHGHYPNLAEIMPDTDGYMSVYSFGQAFWHFMQKNHADYPTIRDFFLSGLDWNVFDISYEEIDAGYINYLKTIAGIQTDPPGQPSNPQPQNQATAVSTNPTLSWNNGSNTDQIDLYFGTSNPPTQKVLNNMNATTTYQPATLSYQTTYYWKVVNRNTVGETEGAAWSFTTDIGTGIFDDDKEAGIQLYPNPADKIVTIASPEPVDLSIFNLAGQCVLERKDFLNDQIDLSGYQKGTYFVAFTNRKGKLIKQLIIK
ncbi:MAG: hypothetical protein CVU00_08155 [Bacteroidetes bacterium HGW-Bacteroidetes-17]|jgi:hypothetical protein|nr:MAG: hypothetical protein CVU00_08155 [Bacteroidetes bacterium HGW-Bacteroidetes-17]